MNKDQRYNNKNIFSNYASNCKTKNKKQKNVILNL